MRRASALALLACVAVLALAMREISNLRLTVLSDGDMAAGWFCGDPDGQYHMRRLERALVEGLPVAEFDAAINHPYGSAIPWPPYYTYALYALIAPLAARDDAARRELVEHAVATLPAVFGSLAAVVAALAASRLARRRGAGARVLAAGVAGGVFAAHGGSIATSVPGIGDHHAWVTLLLAALFALASMAGERESLDSPRRSAWLGIAAGATAGGLVGSWVAGLVYVLVVEAALGVEIALHAREPRRGLAALGSAFHLAYAAALAPAVLASPWKEAQPWMVVNLSWFHLAHALAGALVFAPLAFAGSRPRARRAWPWIVAAAIAALAIAAALGDSELARSVREGFAWAARANEFMAFIVESQPLLAGQSGGLDTLLRLCGLAAFVLPVAWIALASRAWRERGGASVVWAVAIPPLACQALAQQRFTDALGVPMAVALGWGAAEIAQRAPRLRERAWAALPLGLACAAALQWPTIGQAWKRLDIGERYARGPSAQDQRGYRALCGWLREHAARERDAGVLAVWTHGHSIEWAAGLPTIADNFGSYLGRDSYLDPWRFFLEEDPRRAEELLERRAARYVMITADFTNDLEVALRLLRADDRAGFLARGAGRQLRPGARFFRTMAARAMLDGRVGDVGTGTLSGDSLGFLRLVHVAGVELGTRPPIPHSDAVLPAGWIWERVEGARVEARGAPGESLSIEIALEYPQAAPAPHRLTFDARAEADASGVARVRVPYATDAANGDGRASGPARWRFGARSGAIAIPERAVRKGSAVVIEP